MRRTTFSTLSAHRAATDGPSEYLTSLCEAWAAHKAKRKRGAPTVVSLFAGCGGSSLGYSMAGYRELVAVETDQNACLALSANFPKIAILRADITKLSGNELMQRAGIRRGQLHTLDGSPPCQGFSTSGKRDMQDPRNILFESFARLLAELQPRTFVMENVAGMVKGKMKLVFVDALRVLRACGYDVRASVLSAAYYGVPQLRERLFFVGARLDTGAKASLPPPASRLVSVAEAFSELQEPMCHAPIARNQNTVLPLIAEGSTAIRCLTTDELRQYIPRMLNRNYTFNAICYRLSRGRPAYTLPKTYIAYSQTPIHPTKHRFISAEEAARLCGFPDQFKLSGKYEQRIARLGNSVPPLFMRAIAAHIRREMLDGHG